MNAQGPQAQSAYFNFHNAAAQAAHLNAAVQAAQQAPPQRNPVAAGSASSPSSSEAISFHAAAAAAAAAAHAKEVQLRLGELQQTVSSGLNLDPLNLEG